MLAAPLISYSTTHGGPHAFGVWAREHIVPWAVLHSGACELPASESVQYEVQKAFRIVPHFARHGIKFCHIHAIPHRPALSAAIVAWMRDVVRTRFPEACAILAIETGGLLFAAPVAYALQLPLVVVRKASAANHPGKEPDPASRVTHQGSNATREQTCLELRYGAFAGLRGDIVLLDDVLASGETACAALELLHNHHKRKLRGVVCAVEFPCFRGRERLAPAEVESLVRLGGW